MKDLQRFGDFNSFPEEAKVSDGWGGFDRQGVRCNWGGEKAFKGWKSSERKSSGQGVCLRFQRKGWGWPLWVEQSSGGEWWETAWKQSLAPRCRAPLNGVPGISDFLISVVPKGGEGRMWAMRAWHKAEAVNKNRLTRLHREFQGEIGDSS